MKKVWIDDANGFLSATLSKDGTAFHSLMLH